MGVMLMMCCITACLSRPVPQGVYAFSPIWPIATNQDLPEWDPKWGWYFGGRYERAPDEARTPEAFGIRLENLAGEPLANVLIPLDGDAPIWVDAKPVFRTTPGLIDSEDPDLHHQEREHVFRRLDARGLPERIHVDDGRIRLTLPGGGADDEIWISFPSDEQPGLGSWEYANDVGPIVLGRVVAWRMRLGIACRSPR